MMRLLTLALVSVIAIGDCRTSSAPPKNDAVEALRTALTRIEGKDPVVIVPGKDLPESAARAAAEIREVVRESRIRTSEAFTLPPRHFRLETLEVTGDSAVIRGWLGPIPKPKPGVISMECGTGYMVSLKRHADGKGWEVDRIGIAVC